MAFPERLNVMTDRALIGCCYNVARKYNKVNLIVYFKKYKRSDEKSKYSVLFLLGCAGCSV